ncbi:hypothetical protein DFAR_920017 [Desulfarculales bacterium]
MDLYATNAVEERTYILEYSEARIYVVENECCFSD